MARIQPTEEHTENTEDQEVTEVTEDQEVTEDEQADEVTETVQATGDQASNTDTEPTAEDRIAHVHTVLTEAAEATDSATGTIPLAQLAAIGTAIRTVRGNARVEAVSTWSVAAFTGGELDPIAIGAVIAAASNPTTSKPAAPTMPAHEVLAYRLALLELAADKLKAEARTAQGDTDDESDVVEMALDHWTSESFEVPDSLAARVDKVAAEASKGTGRRTSNGGHGGPRADLVDLVTVVMADHDLGAEVPFAEVKTAVVAAGGSAGGALDNRFAALVEATGNGGADMTAATRTIYEAGVRAVHVGSERYLYNVAD